MRRRASWAPTAVLAAVAALAALAAACSTRSPAPRGTTTTLGPLSDDGRRQEITALWTQIRQWRLDASLSVEPEADAVAAMSAVPMTDAAARCERPAPAGGTCRDVCDLGSAICDNAGAICRIAGELAGDTWAHDKCNSAKASCREAEARCCGCSRSTMVGEP